MKVIIAGSRNVKDWGTVYFAIAESKFFDITEVVSGTAAGVDKLGEQYGNEFGIPVKQFPANWDEYGKSAGFLRNTQMAEYADALIAIWDGESRGTKHMIDIMNKIGKPVFVYKLEE